MRYALSRTGEKSSTFFLRHVDYCRVCFIKTTNLDGESNLKIRRPVDLGIGEGKVDDASVMGLKGLLQCEPPNANLHQFQGRFETHPGGQPSGNFSLADNVKPACVTFVVMKGLELLGLMLDKPQGR